VAAEERARLARRVLDSWRSPAEKESLRSVQVLMRLARLTVVQPLACLPA
jgi:hypothetical protein